MPADPAPSCSRSTLLRHHLESRRWPCFSTTGKPSPTASDPARQAILGASPRDLIRLARPRRLPATLRSGAISARGDVSRIAGDSASGRVQATSMDRKCVGSTRPESARSPLPIHIRHLAICTELRCHIARHASVTRLQYRCVRSLLSQRAAYRRQARQPHMPGSPRNQASKQTRWSLPATLAQSVTVSTKAGAPMMSLAASSIFRSRVPPSSSHVSRLPENSLGK